MDSEQLRRIITSHIEDADVDVVGENGKFEVTITSKVFDGLGMVDRHRLVYEAVGDEIRGGAIHALSIRAHTHGES